MRLPAPATLATLGEQLDAALEQAIIEGILKPGQRINPDEIAEQYGVSRIPVREALRSLGANGWVDIRPRHGAFVRQRSEAELFQIFEVRGVLDVAAARLAAERRTATHLAELDALAGDCLRAAEQGNRETDVATLNADFHLAVARASGNEVLSTMLGHLGKRVRWYYTAVVPIRGVGSAEEHLELVAAIRDRDPDLAERVVRTHVESTRAVIEAALARRSPDLTAVPPGEAPGEGAPPS
jgi:DNA-binding GntR family transcriptional regulator